MTEIYDLGALTEMETAKIAKLSEATAGYRLYSTAVVKYIDKSVHDEVASDGLLRFSIVEEDVIKLKKILGNDRAEKLRVR